MATSSSSSIELLLISSPDGAITAYDASSGSLVSEFSGSRTPRRGLALISNKIIAACHVSPDTGNGSIHLYNWWSSTPSTTLPMPEPVAPLVATAEGLYLFAGGISGRIHSLCLSSGSLVNSLPVHSGPVTCLEINSDGSLIFSGGEDGAISVFSTQQLVMDPIVGCFTPLMRFQGHESSITGITLCGGSRCSLISCSMDCTIKFWTLNKAKPLFSITFPCPIWDLKMDPRETKFYGAGSDGCVYHGELQERSRAGAKHSLKIVPWSANQGKPWTSMATLHRGQCVVSASEDGTVCFWDNIEGKMVKTLETGSISHLVVVVLPGVDSRAKSTEPVARVADQGGSGNLHRWEMELLGSKLPSELAKETMEMREELDDAVKDRKRSVETLELALGGYERLLNMILREVRARGGRGTGGSSSNAVKDGAKRKVLK